MATSIDSFRAALIGGLARTSQFRVDLAFPTVVTGGSAAAQVGQFLCKASALPESNMGKVSAFYHGREVKLPSNREYPDWSITIYNDTNFLLRNSFEKWVEKLEASADMSGLIRPSDYMADMSVTQLDRNSKEVKTYKMIGVWPTIVSNIELDMEGSNPETFTVTLAVQRWESQGITDGGSGFGVNTSVSTPFGTF